MADPPKDDGCFLVAEEVLPGAGRFPSSCLVAAWFLYFDGNRRHYLVAWVSISVSNPNLGGLWDWRKRFRNGQI